MRVSAAAGHLHQGIPPPEGDAGTHQPLPTTNRAATRMTLGSLNPASACGRVRVPSTRTGMSDQQGDHVHAHLVGITGRMAPTSMLSTQINSEFTLAPFVQRQPRPAPDAIRPQSPSPDLLHIKKEETASSHIQVQLRHFTRSVNAVGRLHMSGKSAARLPAPPVGRRAGAAFTPLPSGDDMTSTPRPYPVFTFSRFVADIQAG